MQTNENDKPFSKEVEKKLSEKKVHSRHQFDGRLLQVYTDEVELPDGSRSTRDWIRHPGASAVVPVFHDGTILLVKQFRYPPRKLFLEVPAGKLDPGESPESAARREFTEESGYSAGNINKTGEFYPAIGYADEIIHTYVAWNLSEKGKREEPDEFLINYRIPFSEALKMIAKGDIQDGKTICTLVLAANWWRENGPFPVGL